MKDKHKGESCFVVGNGPSLKDVPNGVLEALPSFGSNRVYLKFLPTFYAVVNPILIYQYGAEIEQLETTKFVRDGMRLSGYQLHSSTRCPFSFEPLSWVNEGYTVTYVLLQLAYWMGFSVVYLLGVDHRYEFEGKPNEERVLDGDDPNHFDPEYFRGATWNNPDLERSERFYREARGVFEADGRKILNLTPDSSLDVFEKI